MSAQVETQDRSIRSARLEMPCLPVEVTSQPFPHDISSRNLFSGTVHKQKKEKKKKRNGSEHRGLCASQPFLKTLNPVYI